MRTHRYAYSSEQVLVLTFCPIPNRSRATSADITPSASCIAPAVSPIVAPGMIGGPSASPVTLTIPPAMMQHPFRKYPRNMTSSFVCELTTRLCRAIKHFLLSIRPERSVAVGRAVCALQTNRSNLSGRFHRVLLQGGCYCEQQNQQKQFVRDILPDIARKV